MKDTAYIKYGYRYIGEASKVRFHLSLVFVRKKRRHPYVRACTGIYNARVVIRILLLIPIRPFCFCLAVWGVTTWLKVLNNCCTRNVCVNSARSHLTQVMCQSLLKKTRNDIHAIFVVQGYLHSNKRVREAKKGVREESKLSTYRHGPSRTDGFRCKRTESRRKSWYSFHLRVRTHCRRAMFCFCFVIVPSNKTSWS